MRVANCMLTKDFVVSTSLSCGKASNHLYLIFLPTWYFNRHFWDTEQSYFRTTNSRGRGLNKLFSTFLSVSFNYHYK